MGDLPIGADGRVALANSAVGAGDNPYVGLICSAAGAARAIPAVPTQFSNGCGFDNTGRLCYIDATAGLPANTSFNEGIPYGPTGQMCVSTGAIANTSNGVPYVANGAVAATIT